MKHKTETSRRSAGSKGSHIEIRSGSEGPRHDPYSYQEITVTRQDGREAMIHLGLAAWMTYWDGRIQRKFDDQHEVLFNKFEACIGINPAAAAKVLEKARSNKIRHHACGHKHLHEVEGFPGETLLHCSKCGSILDGDFNLSVIE
jgi:hypothetical protein